MFQLRLINNLRELLATSNAVEATHGRMRHGMLRDSKDRMLGSIFLNVPHGWEVYLLVVAADDSEGHHGSAVHVPSVSAAVFGMHFAGECPVSHEHIYSFYYVSPPAHAVAVAEA